MQHRLLDDYVTEIAPRRATNTETNLDAEEIGQHLGALADAHAELGMTEDEAARAAIQQFGAARAVRHDLKRASLRGRIVRAARTNAGAATLAGFAMALPGLYSTFSANYVTPPPAVAAFLARSDAAFTVTVATGAYFPLVALVAGLFLAFQRGRGAFSLIPFSAVIATLLPFAMMSLVKGFFLNWPVNATQWAMVVTTATSLMLYAYVGALAGTLWRWERAKRAGV